MIWRRLDNEARWVAVFGRLRGARSYRAARKGARDYWQWRVDASDNFQKHSVGLENKKKGIRKWRTCKRNYYRCTTSFYQALKSALFVGIKFDLPIARECIQSKLTRLMRTRISWESKSSRLSGENRIYRQTDLGKILCLPLPQTPSPKRAAVVAAADYNFKY